ncbi:unnamed protein product, partial [Amoebophrya sp. A25]
ELLSGTRCPGKSVKRMELVPTVARRIPYMDGMEMQKGKPTRTMFWFDDERIDDILYAARAVGIHRRWRRGMVSDRQGSGGKPFKQHPRS